MSVAMPKEKARLIVDIDEPALLSSIKKAILLLKGVSAVNVKQPKVKMTENEFFSKLDLSVASQKKANPFVCDKMNQGWNSSTGCCALRNSFYT